MPAELIYERQGKGKVTVPLNKEFINIGRDRENDLLLDYDTQVSSKHARIISEGKKFFIEDLGSTNKTFVNKVQINARTELSHNSQVKIGNTLFTFLNHPEEDGTVMVNNVFPSTVPQLVPPTMLSSNSPTVPQVIKSIPSNVELTYERQGKGKISVPLNKEFIKIGRGLDSDIMLDFDSQISTKHAQISCIEKKFFIEDLGSTNKTFINDIEIIGKTQLKQGDRIKIGNIIFTFIDNNIPAILPSSTLPYGKPPLKSSPSTLPYSGTKSPVSQPPSSQPSEPGTMPSGSLRPQQPGGASGRLPSGPLTRRKKKFSLQKYIIPIALIAIILGTCAYYVFYVGPLSKIEAFLDKAEDFFDKGEYEKALKEYEKILDLDKNNTEAYQGLGDCYRGMYKYDEAITQYKKIVGPYVNDPVKMAGLASKPDELKFVGERVNDIGGVYLLDNNYKEAEYWYKIIDKGEYMKQFDSGFSSSNSKEIKKLHAASLVGLGKIDMKNYKYKNAKDKFDDAKDKDDKNADAAIGLGRLAMEKKEYDEAMRIFTEVQAKDPNNVEADLAIAEVYKRQKKYDKAITEYDEIIKDHPGEGKAYSGKADVYKSKKNYDMAIDCLKKGEDKDGRNPDINITRARLYMDKGKYSDAEKELDKVLDDKKGKHKNSLEAKNLLGKLYQKDGRKEKAIDEYKEILEYDPDNFEANRELGRVILNSDRKNKYDNSITYLQKAKDINPADKDNYKLLGKAYDGKELHTRAIENFETAYRIDNKDTENCCDLGDSYKKVGSAEKAKEYYNNALDVDRHCERAREGLRSLGGY
jgi:tetratricopeptide (TPR) repeat protein/pSer/pThr/pTyr-binding forkhead associated (FHA) protein